MIVRSKYVVPVDRPLIENGAVAYHDGVITHVGPWPSVEGRCDLDLGQTAILPGLVNAHTHLELTDLAGVADPGVGFLRWIETLGPRLRSWVQEPESIAASVRHGLRLSMEHGVTTLGDISRHPSIARPIQRSGPLRVVSYGEVIASGPIRHLADARLKAALDGGSDSEFLRSAVSPHAPYSVDPEVFRECVRRAQTHGRRLCVHAAESREEVEFIQSHQGPFRELIERLGLWDDGRECFGSSPIEFLSRVGALGPGTVLAHANYVNREDICILAETGTHVAYCPRTHAAFGHDPHPFQAMQRAGVNVCFGTDSLASNPSLSVLDEARFLYERDPTLSPESLIEGITLRGAKALGMDDRIGSLSPGKCADMIVLGLEKGTSADPLEALLRGRQQPLAACVRGWWLQDKIVGSSGRPSEPGCSSAGKPA